MKWEIQLIRYKREKRIRIAFGYDPQKIAEVKKLEDARWKPDWKAWHVADTVANREILGLDPEPELTAERTAGLEDLRRWMRSRRYSENTIGTYTDALRVFLLFTGDKPLDEIDTGDVVAFNNDYILARKLSATYQNQVVNAIKLFFGEIRRRSLDPQLVHRPKKPKILPKVLSEEEIGQILNATENIKHRCMLCLIYSAGLRRSELLDLRIPDIDSQRMIIHIKNAKGRKDRIVPLSETILLLLRQYYLKYTPQKYLFEGQDGGRYSERSLALVLKNACRVAGINKNVNLHMLRHSYATHLLENGTDLRYIQELLGHNSSRTTEIYTHVSRSAISKIRSPLDKLNIKISGNEDP